MRIHFHKRDLLTINIEENVATSFAQFFAVNWDLFPSNTWGVPLHFDKLRREDHQPIIDRIIRNISGWMGRTFCYRGELILSSACIVRVPAYLMAIIKLPKWAINVINSQMAHFFWGNMGDSHKNHLAHWGLVSRKRNFWRPGNPNY